MVDGVVENDAQAADSEIEEVIPCAETHKSFSSELPAIAIASTKALHNDEKENSYVSRKPLWWKRVAGRRGTAAQRKAIGRMTENGYVLPRLKKYEHEFNLSKIFEKTPDGQLMSPNDVLVPRFKDENGETHSNTDNIAKSKNISLELGFGLGDNILSNATKFPDRYYIGAEIHQPGVGIALMRMEKAINAKTYWLEQKWLKDSDLVDIQEREKLRDPSSSMKPYDNLRIFPGDGIKLLGSLPDNSLDSVYLPFPDPWPDEQHHHWRVIQEETVHLIGKVLKPGGCFYLATDALGFESWTVSIFELVIKKANDWEEISLPDRANWLPVISKYEEKGVDEGRYTVCRCWRYKVA